MKTEDYIAREKAKLDELGVALRGMVHTPPQPSNIIDLLQHMLGVIDTEQELVDRVANRQTDPDLAKALIERADQLQATRKHVVQALNSAANTEIDI